MLGFHPRHRWPGSPRPPALNNSSPGEGAPCPCKSSPYKRHWQACAPANSALQVPSGAACLAIPLVRTECLHGPGPAGDPLSCAGGGCEASRQRLRQATCTLMRVTAPRHGSTRRPATRPPSMGSQSPSKTTSTVQGYATTCGTPGLSQHRPHASAPLLQRLQDLGALVTGKTGLHELAAGGTCANILFGVIRNPYNLDMVPGGSSGGSAAAVAARLVPAALGTDTRGLDPRPGIPLRLRRISSDNRPLQHRGPGPRRVPARHHGLVRPFRGGHRIPGWFERDGRGRRETRYPKRGTSGHTSTLLLRLAGTPRCADRRRGTATPGARRRQCSSTWDIPGVGALTEQITTALRPEFPEDLAHTCAMPTPPSPSRT